jgi:hypothetical protein
MKKSLVALAALAATSAFAQSSVTLSGSLNYGMSTSVAKATTVGGWKGDRNHLTFAATDDLGGGLKMTGMAQTRFSDSGAATYINSVTGSKNESVFEQFKLTLDTNYGQVAVGRFTNMIGVAPLHPLEDAAQSTASHQAANGRHSGQIQFVSPAFNGAKVWALSAKATSNVYMGGGTGAGYSAAWDLSATNAATNATTAHKDLSALGIDYTNGKLYAQYYQITDLMNTKQTKIGATYDFGSFKLYANQFNQKDNITQVVAKAATWKMTGVNTVVQDAAAVVAGAGTSGMAAHKATELAVTVPYGAWNFQLGRFQADKDLDLAKTDGSTKTQKTGWGATYNFSKRTQGIYAASTTSKGSANLNSGGLATGRNQFIGLQTTF